MENSILKKKQHRFIYLIIILCFLLIAWSIWLFFEWRMEDAEFNAKRNNATATVSKIISLES